MKHFNIIISICSFILLLFIYIVADLQELSIGLLTFTLGIVLFNFVLFFINSFNDPILQIRKQFIRPVLFFLIGYFIVFYQAYIDLILGNLNVDDGFFFIKSSLINQAALLSSIGILTLFIGYYSVIKRTNKKVIKHTYVPLKLLVLLFTVINAVSIYLNLDSFLYEKYTQAQIEESAGTIGSYFQLLFYIIYLAIIILYAINFRLIGGKDIWSFVKGLGGLFYCNILVYLGLVMMSGDRDPILSFTLTYLCAMAIGTQVKIKPKILLLGIISGAVLFSFLGIVRKMDENSSFIEKVFEASSDDNMSNYESFFVPTAELSTSVRTLHLSMDYVPYRHPYTFGLFQLRESLKAIPFAAGLFEPLFPSHFRFINSAFFITWIDKGEIYFVGTGSSIIADLYLSFGELGVIIFMFILGRIFRILDLSIFDRDISKIPLNLIILSIVILGSSISWSRGTYLSPIKAFALAFILVTVFKFIFTAKKRKIVIN